MRRGGRDAALTPTVLADVATLWDYHHVHHEPRPTDVGVGLGSHDIGVASHTAELFHRGMFPRIVFTGANAPTTAERFPRGEAVHFRDHAVALGVPAGAILVETEARSTPNNIRLVRDLLRREHVDVTSATLITRPYQQRRALGIARKLWPDLDVHCSVQPVALGEYLEQIGDARLVVNTIVADTERLSLDHMSGNAIRQPVPEPALSAFRRLVAAGFDDRVIDGL